MRKKCIAIFFCIAAICYAQVLTAQTEDVPADTSATDSVDTHHYHDYGKTAVVEYFTGSAFGEFHAIDTSLQDFEKFNPARLDFQDTYLTNAGSAIQQKYFIYDRITGFDKGRDQFEKYRYDIDSLWYYRTNTPFTDLFYVTGSHAEQLLRVKHAQNFGPRFNIALDYEKMKSDGFYTNDLKSHENLALTSWYETKNKVYHVQGAFLYNNIKNNENGGLTSDIIFQEQGQFPLASVYRSSAITRWKSFRGQVTQTLSLAVKKEYNVNDTLTAEYAAPYLEIRHTFGLGDEDYMFQDPFYDSSYYGLLYDYMDTLRDVSDLDGFYNRLSVGNPLYNTISVDSVTRRNFIWNIFIEQQQHDLSDQSGHNYYHNLIAGADVHHIIPGTIFEYSGNASVDILRATYYVNGRIIANNSYFAPFFSYTRSELEPTVIQEHYYGFNNRWENNFEHIKMHTLYAGAISEKGVASLALKYYRFANYIYSISDTTAGIIPAQSDDPVNILQLVLEKNFNLGKFHLENKIALQKTAQDIISIPEIIAAHNWYFETYLFKSALKMRTGIDVFYNSAYNLYNYDIVTGLFGLQTVTTSSFYPYADVYAAFDIRTFRFFLKLENTGQGIYYDGYYEAVHYPMQNRSFKLGVSWNLFY